MSDFEFLQNKQNGKWVISAPRRSHRTNVSGDIEPICPFCPGRESTEEELYRVPGKGTDGTKETILSKNGTNVLDPSGSSVPFVSCGSMDWKVRVITNKFPFAPNHEVIIHSTDHHKSFDELPFSQVELILQTYRQRFIAHKKDGPSSDPTDAKALAGKKAIAGKQVYLLHNSGSAAGASLSHPHSQLVVIPQNVKLEITPLDPTVIARKDPSAGSGQAAQSLLKEIATFPLVTRNDKEDVLETDHFYIFCPKTSEWPDEVWIAPKQNGGGFGLIKDPEVTDLGFVLSRIIQIFDLRHGHEFPFNFYIPPLKNWYLRLIPRIKIIGGFELGTNIIVNTQDPKETFNFIQEHFWNPDNEKIKSKHQAEYRKRV